MNATTDSGDIASYIALVPRGLHLVFAQRLQKEIEDAGHSLSDVSFVGERNALEEEQYAQHLTELLSKRKKQPYPNIGAVVDPLTNQHVSIGYDASNKLAWSHPGEASFVWTRFTTNAPVDFVNNRLRFIGPLLAEVQVFEHIELDETTSLYQIESLLEKLDFETSRLDEALRLWHLHVQDSWPLSKEELDDVKNKLQQDECTSSLLKYRLSCVRPHSKRYSFSREEFCRAAADHVVPPATRRWKVDLVNYDIELVLLIQPKYLALGISLRPYRKLGSKGFEQGILPPDVTPPYLSGSILSGLVRLRPATAKLLWGLLDLRAGDVVLDPCAGIGTIPLEVPDGVVGLGGDLILNTDTCRPLVADYTKKMKRHNVSCQADLLAWDATMLPLRDACVDALCSDLPFGQQCLSTAKLEGLLPLILGEVSRVLRPGGTMLLLCGAYQLILDALGKLNSLQSGGLVWNLPCEVVFPVNIGGLVAWVIKVKRGAADMVLVSNHTERVRKLVSKRRHHQQNMSREATEDDGHKYRRLQK